MSLDANGLPTIFLINGRGDYLLNIPALRAFSTAYDGAVCVVAAPGAREMIFPDIPVARSLELPFETSPKGKEFDAAALAKALGPIPVFVSLNPWHSESMDELLDLLDCPRTVGFVDEFDETIALDFRKHTMDLAFDVIRHLVPNAAFDDHISPPGFRPKDMTLADEVAGHLRPASPLIGVHFETLPQKELPAPIATELIVQLAETWRNGIIVDVGLISAVAVDQRPENYFHLSGLGLATGFSLMRHMDVFVGVDSCFLHAADFCRVPLVGLFGPTDPHEFGARLGGTAQHLKRAEMSDYSAQDIIQEMSEMLVSDQGLVAQ